MLLGYGGYHGAFELCGGFYLGAMEVYYIDMSGKEVE